MMPELVYLAVFVAFCAINSAWLYKTELKKAQERAAVRALTERIHEAP